MKAIATKLYASCSLLILIASAVACFSRPPVRPTPAGVRSGDQALVPLQAGKFEAEKQNQIFKTIVSSAETPSCELAPGKPQVRLVTASEYVSSIEDAFEIDLDDRIIKAALPTDAVGTLGFEHLRQFNVISAERLASYLAVNEQVAAQVKEKRAAIVNCGRAAGDCVQTWMSSRLPRLWRMSLDAASIQNELAKFEAWGGNLDAFGLLVERLLLSPYFLFRQALGSNGKLGSWEVASLLADVLWAGPPSAELVQLAEQNGLATAASIRQQAGTMINDPRLFAGLKNFTSAWLTTGLLDRKDFAQAGNAVITSEIKNGLKDEAAAFLYLLMRNEQAQFKTMFEADFTVGSDAFAGVYGLTPTGDVVPGLPNAYKKLMFPVQRKGLASQPSVITTASNVSTTNIPLRGKHIMEKFLCQTLETPPNLATVVANTKFDTSLSVRDAFEKATNVGSCADCHKLVNGIGYGMENIGPDGRLQMNDTHGFPVMNPLGDIFFPGVGSEATATDFSGVAGLSQTLASSSDAALCLSVQVFRMVYGRLEEEADVCTIVEAYKNAKQTELTLNDLLTEMIVLRAGHRE